MENAEFKRKVIQGVAWNGISQVANRVFQLVVLIVLARLLGPKDFGIVGIVSMLTGFVAMFTELGLSTAIIQKKQVKEQHLSTAFFVSIFFGFVLWILSVFASPMIASFFRNEALGQIFPVASIGLVVGAFGITHNALLTKGLKFRQIALADMVSSVTYGIVAIIFAMNNFGAWSLVAGTLALALTRTCLLWITCKWRPKFQIELAGFGEYFLFGIKVFGSNLIGYFRNNIDYLLIGRFLGVTPLGFYTIAFKIADFPKRNLVSIIIKVAFPAFSSIQDSNERMRAGYIKSLKLISLLVFPLLFGVAVLAEEFVTTVYGAKWMPAVLPLQILLLMGVLISLIEPGIAIFFAKGRPDLQLRSSILYAVILSLFALAGISFGIVGIAIAVLISTAIAFLFIQYYVILLIEVRLKECFFALLPATISAFIMMLVIIIYKRLQVQVLNISDTWWIASAVMLGAAIYLTTVSLFKVKEANEYLRIAVRILWQDIKLALIKLKVFASSSPKLAALDSPVINSHSKPSPGSPAEYNDNMVSSSGKG